MFPFTFRAVVRFVLGVATIVAVAVLTCGCSFHGDLSLDLVVETPEYSAPFAASPSID